MNLDGFSQLDWEIVWHLPKPLRSSSRSLWVHGEPVMFLRSRVGGSTWLTNQRSLTTTTAPIRRKLFGGLSPNGGNFSFSGPQKTNGLKWVELLNSPRWNPGKLKWKADNNPKKGLNLLNQKFLHTDISDLKKGGSNPTFLYPNPLDRSKNPRKWVHYRACQKFSGKQ